MDSKQVISIAAQSGIPAILWGDPGEGKTTYWEEFAKHLGVPIEIIIASIRDPSDFGGIPIPDGTGFFRLSPPGWARDLNDKAENLDGLVRGIVFVDETTTIPPNTQAALLRVVKDAWVGEYRLNPHIIRVAAANPPEIAAGGWHLSPPLANRFIHFDWKVTPQEWAEASLNDFQSGFPFSRIRDNWQEHIPAKRALISAFIQSRPQLWKVLPQNENDSGKAWPSGRTWDYAGQLLACGESVNVDFDAQMILVAGAVGPSAASEFMTYFRELDLPDPEQLLKNPGSFKLPDRVDKVFAVLSSVVSAVINNRSVERWNSAWEIVAKAATDGRPDVAAFAARSLSKFAGEGFPMPKKHMGPFVDLLNKTKEWNK